MLGLLDEKYDDRALGTALERYIGSARLSDSPVPLLVTAYDLPTRTPFFFKSWRAKTDPAWDFPLAQVARATAAAPTYFEPLCIGERALVDGGVFVTNPAMCAFAEAARLRRGEPPFVVSLGTGQLTRPISGKDAAGWGLLEWVRPLIDGVFDGVADTVEYQLEELAQDPVRLQVALTRASDALDDASARNLALLKQARELIAGSSAELDGRSRGSWRRALGAGRRAVHLGKGGGREPGAPGHPAVRPNVRRATIRPDSRPERFRPSQVSGLGVHREHLLRKPSLTGDERPPSPAMRSLSTRRDSPEERARAR